MFRKGIVFTGSGGQGVITASIILAEAAGLHGGMNAVQAQAYGPEARGGATRADVVLSDEAILYPKVIKPHILVCLTQLAYDKFSPLVRPGGVLLTDSFYIQHQHKSDAIPYHLSMYKSVMDKIGKPIVFNICMLGTLIGLTGLIDPQPIMKVLETKIPKGFLEMNREALELGLELAEKVNKKN